MLGFFHDLLPGRPSVAAVELPSDLGSSWALASLQCPEGVCVCLRRLWEHVA
jgi:hypothetical protein